MLRKKIIIAVSALFCTPSVWGSQTALDSSSAYISKVTSHLDGLAQQNTKIKAAEDEATSAQKNLQSVKNKVGSVQKDFDEAQDNISAYPRRINRDNQSIADKRAESQSIFRNTFPEFSTPDEAIRSVNSSRNRLQEEKNILTGRLQRKENEFGASLSRARSEAESNRLNLNRNQQELSNLESLLPRARQEFREANQAFRRAQQLKEDPQLPNKIRQAQREFEQINQVRIERGKSCGGFSPIFSGVCRRYIDARNKVAELQALAAPGSLRPFRQKRNQAENRLEDLRVQKRNLVSDTKILEDNLRRAESRVADLEEDLRIETRPIKNEIAELDGQLNRLSSKLAKAKKLETLESEIGSLQRRVQRNESKLAALPALIEKLQEDLALAQSDLENSQEALADLNENLAREKNVLIDQKNEINSLRTQMNESLNTIEVLNPSAAVTPNIDTVIMESRDWNVLTTDRDNEWGRATCRAETQDVTVEGEEGNQITTATLKVVNLVNPTSGFNEPLVVVTFESTRADLVSFQKVTVRASSSKTYTFDLIYSKSDDNKLLFVADLNDRTGLLELIIKKSQMKVTLSSVDAEASEEITFSLKGSTKAVNSRSSRDNSLRTACGGIKVQEI